MDVMLVVKKYGDSIIEGANISIVMDRCNNRLARALGTENFIAEIIALNNNRISFKDTKIIKDNDETLIVLVNYIKTSIMFKGAVLNSKLSELKLKLNSLDETDNNKELALELKKQLEELEEERFKKRKLNSECMEIMTQLVVNS